MDDIASLPSSDASSLFDGHFQGDIP
jgi:hypothetical protein